MQTDMFMHGGREYSVRARPLGWATQFPGADLELDDGDGGRVVVYLVEMTANELRMLGTELEEAAHVLRECAAHREAKRDPRDGPAAGESATTEPARGPWRVDDMFDLPGEDGELPERAPSTWIARSPHATGLELRFACAEPRDSIVADTRLVAAAPELLHFAESVVAMAEERIVVDPTGCATLSEPFLAQVEAAREVLAKVRGEEAS